MQITEAAAERMKTAVLHEIDEKEKCFRIAMSAAGVDLVIDEHREGDVTFEYEGTLILVLDATADDAIGELVLDYDPEQSELVFRREVEFEEIIDIDAELDDKLEEG